jgi:hypothetical protein
MPSKRLGIVGVLPKQFIPIRMKFLLMEGAWFQGWDFYCKMF